MLRRFARGVALGVLLACQGCPGPTPPAPVATPVPAPLAAVALPAFAGDAPALADPGPGVTPEATYAATDTGAPSEVVPSERVETLGTGAVLEPAGRLALGLAGYYERDGVRRARLSAAEGQVCLEYLLGPGERARVGQAVFRLEASQGGAPPCAGSAPSPIPSGPHSSCASSTGLSTLREPCGSRKWGSTASATGGSWPWATSSPAPRPR